MFEFIKENQFINDGVIDLRIYSMLEGIKEINTYPSYCYKVYLHKTDTLIGSAGIRLGTNGYLYYAGNIEYQINEEYRNKGYAKRICQLLKNVAKSHRQNTLIVTCQKHNVPSNRVIKSSGFTFVEYAKVPINHQLYKRGISNINIYSINLESEKKL